MRAGNDIFAPIDAICTAVAYFVKIASNSSEQAELICTEIGKCLVERLAEERQGFSEAEVDAVQDWIRQHNHVESIPPRRKMAFTVGEVA